MLRTTSPSPKPPDKKLPAMSTRSAQHEPPAERLVLQIPVSCASERLARRQGVASCRQCTDGILPLTEHCGRNPLLFRWCYAAIGCACLMSRVSVARGVGAAQRNHDRLRPAETFSMLRYSVEDAKSFFKIRMNALGRVPAASSFGQQAFYNSLRHRADIWAAGYPCRSICCRANWLNHCLR